jgi:hypothetical protein
MMTSFVKVFLIMAGSAAAYLVHSSPNATISFSDDFENGTAKWELNVTEKIEIVDSGDPAHGEVLSLTPGGEFVRALVRGSEGWNRYKVEADFLFPTSGDNYFGLIYHFTRTGPRIDFGSIYVKGNGSYIRVNPRRDYNAHRTLYEEYKTPLVGEDAIVIGEWKHFKAEVIDSVCHFYVGDMATPKVTFDAFELGSGRLGFKPRVVGESVWIDNVHVSEISQFSYSGASKPEGIVYEPERLITDWQAIGPFCGTLPDLERDGFLPEKTYTEHGTEYRWRKFETDKRGCVVSGRLTEFIGGRNIAYFHTTIHSATKQSATLQVSANEGLAFWFNGEFLGYDDAARYAWYDFWKNPDHKGVTGPLELEPGENSLLIRVRGGKYAGGGFFARVQKERAK